MKMAATMQIHEMSKTYQYRKVMKPMLERKRRARINKCLDELKDLMVATLESEGEHVTRLEKADILELTVQHLQKLKQKRKLGIENHFQTNSANLSQAEGFRSGFMYAANEISRNLANLPGVNITFGTKLMTHLGQRLNQLHHVPLSTTPTTSNVKIPIPIHHPITINCGAQHQATTNLLTPTTTTIISPQTSSISPLSISNSSIKNNSSYESYSIQLSPISNYSQSPRSHNTTMLYDTRTTTKSENYHNGNNGNCFLHQESEENVWRPW